MPKLLTPAISTALLITTFGLALFANDARGATRQRGFVKNATGLCKAALPVFEGQIRKRPLALQNEGTASAFISCSLVNPSVFTTVGLVELLADNNTSTPVDLTCTLITSIGRFLPKTITMVPGSGANSLLWTAADNGGVPFTSVTLNLSCNLPVGSGLSKTLVGYDDEVGA